MKIELWPIAKPVPYARNARKIPQSAIDKIAGSIKVFGFRQPIVVDKEGVKSVRDCDRHLVVQWAVPAFSNRRHRCGDLRWDEENCPLPERVRDCGLSVRSLSARRRSWKPL
jgi:hypothetical protein